MENKQYHWTLDYGVRLKNYSSLIYAWTVDNNLGLFDFDSLGPRSVDHMREHLNYTKEQTRKVVVVEQHPTQSFDTKKLEIKNQIITTANHLDIELFFLTPNYTHWDQPHNHECFYPHWYFELRSHANKHNIKNFSWSNTRKYNFSCNNMANYRSEKIYNYIECFRKKRPDWKLSLYDHPNLEITKIDIRNAGNLTEEQMKIWNQEIKHTIKLYEYDLLNNEPLNGMSMLFAGHTDAYCNLVMEHSMEIEILSEKSFKPFVAKQIPIYLAKPGACTFLNKLGFDLFYDFVDHNKYDNISRESCLERIDQVHNIIDELYTRNFEDFIHDSNTKLRLEKNCDYFYSDAIDKMCIQKINSLIN
jgi:hypothetical protein